MKFILFSIPFCRWYYLVCSIMLLWMLGAKITGPGTSLCDDEWGGPYLRPGYYTLVMMYHEGQWHKVFSEDKDRLLPEGYTLENNQYYINGSLPWSAKPVGKVICWTTGALFVLVLLSPFWHCVKNQKFVFAFLGAAILLFIYWLYLERSDESETLPTLLPQEYYMTIPCLLVWAGCLYRILFCRRMQWDQKGIQQAFAVFLMEYRQKIKLIAVVFAILFCLSYFCCLVLSIFWGEKMSGYFYHYEPIISSVFRCDISIVLASLLAFLFPQKVAMLLV